MTIKELYNSGEGQPICKMELDLQNVAKGSAVYIDDVLDTDAEILTDGHRAHINSSGATHYFEKAEGEFYTHLDFGGLRTINRINIFWYPKSTLVGDITGNVITDFEIEYATTQTGGLPSGWEHWTGLKDRSSEIGQVATAISGGNVSDNENTYNSFMDLDGVSAYGVRIYFAEAITPVRICQIEVWESIELNDFQRFNLNKKRDNILGVYHASIGKATQIAAVDEFYPHKGKFINIDKDNIPEISARIYGGLNKQGVDLWDIQGHFWVFDWTIYQKKKIIEFKIKDRVKILKDTKVFLGIETLRDKNREWLIEWMALEAGISADEVSLFETERTVQMFYPVNSPIWDEMNEISKGLGDVSLYIDNYNILHWEVYSNPHKWYMPDDIAWSEGTLLNMDIIDNKVKPRYNEVSDTPTYPDFGLDPKTVTCFGSEDRFYIAGVRFRLSGLDRYQNNNILVYMKWLNNPWVKIIDFFCEENFVYGLGAKYKDGYIYLAYMTGYKEASAPYRYIWQRAHIRKCNKINGNLISHNQSDIMNWNANPFYYPIHFDIDDDGYFRWLYNVVEDETWECRCIVMNFANFNTQLMFQSSTLPIAVSLFSDRPVPKQTQIMIKMPTRWEIWRYSAGWSMHSSENITGSFNPSEWDWHILYSQDIATSGAIVCYSGYKDLYWWSTEDTEDNGHFELNPEDSVEWAIAGIASDNPYDTHIYTEKDIFVLFLKKTKGVFSHLVRDVITFTGNTMNIIPLADWTITKSIALNTNTAPGTRCGSSIRKDAFLGWTEFLFGKMIDSNFYHCPRNFAPTDITSPIKDLDTDTFHSGVLDISCYLFDNLIIKTYTRTSDNEVDWDEWILIDADGSINSDAKRYIQWKVVFESSGLVYGDIALSSAYFFWSTGEGIARFTQIDWNFSSEDIEEIPISFANEDEGKKIKYSKVEVKANPFILNTSAKIWDGDIDWTAEAGKSYNYNVIFENPCEVDADYKLKINGHYYPEGESTYGGLTVTFTRHPISPQVLITAGSNTNITEYFIEGKEWTQTSGRIYSVGEGIETLQIENKYLSESFLSQDTANKIYKVLSEIVAGIRREMSIPYCPTMDLRNVIKIENNELSLTRFYQVLDISHDIKKMSTKVKCAELDLSIYYDPLYWEERIAGVAVSWGASNTGTPYYFGGYRYG